MAWSTPRGSRPGQGMVVEGNSGGADGSSLPGGGPAAVGDGGKGVGRRRSAETPLHQFHPWPSCVTALPDQDGDGRLAATSESRTTKVLASRGEGSKPR